MTQGGFGLKVRIDVGAVQTAIVSLLDGDMPQFEKFIAESTSHGSAQGYSEFVATGQRQINGFKFTIGFDKTAATHAAVVAGFNSDNPVVMSVQDPDSVETIQFSAHIIKLGRMAKMKEAYKCEVEVQPTGPATIV